MTNKADTSIDQLINIVQQANNSTQIPNNLLKVLTKTIPIISKKRRIPMPDSNLNRTFKIKRINHSVIATITSLSDNIYTAKILSVDGNSFNRVGDKLSISRRELEITGRPMTLKS